MLQSHANMQTFFKNNETPCFQNNLPNKDSKEQYLSFDDSFLNSEVSENDI